MPPAGFEPATPASDRPQTLALDRSATDIGNFKILLLKIGHSVHFLTLLTRAALHSKHISHLRTQIGNSFVVSVSVVSCCHR